VLELKGKAAVVTGASSDEGIGSECAKILASRGCNVVVNYATNKAGGEKIAAACRAAGADAIAVQGDVSKNEDCERLIKACIDKWGRLDVLINNAATTKPIPHKRMDLLDAAEFQRIFAVNVIGTYQMTRAAAPHLKATGDAAIVNISSVGAMRAGGSSMAYTASKAAINNLTLSTARALAPEVRVNALCPGGMLGAWTRKILTEEQYQERLAQAKTQYPLKRGIWPKDVAVAALFLVEGATTMTGEALRMDCGQHLGETSNRT
jgi:NAD(P)-dependent dehydrogenase (short-subunit alcohol dehydrogenase family)